MRLLSIGTGEFAVLAVVDESDRCQVLDVVNGNEEVCKAARPLLRVYLPNVGISKVTMSRKALGNGIERIRRARDGKRLDIYLFMDGNLVIICACAELADEDAPESREVLGLARDTIRSYFEDNKHGNLEILGNEQEHIGVKADVH